MGLALPSPWWFCSKAASSCGEGYEIYWHQLQMGQDPSGPVIQQAASHWSELGHVPISEHPCVSGGPGSPGTSRDGMVRRALGLSPLPETPLPEIGVSPCNTPPSEVPWASGLWGLQPCGRARVEQGWGRRQEGPHVLCLCCLNAGLARGPLAPVGQAEGSRWGGQALDGGLWRAASPCNIQSSEDPQTRPEASDLLAQPPACAQGPSRWKELAGWSACCISILRTRKQADTG